MLKSTFLHLTGVGKQTERALWKKGVLNWKTYTDSFQKQNCLPFGLTKKTPLSESIAAYESGNIKYFANTLPSSEYYRLALEFPKEVIFLDIETTGLSTYYDIITIVGWSIGNEYGVYINGQNEDQFRQALAKAKVLVTFNGTLFDLKFIKKYFDSLNPPPVHLDLRYFAKRVGLSGGQKVIEKKLGFKREIEIKDMLGEAAPILWHKYRRGDQEAMRRLIEYNHADIEGMKWILDHSIELYFEKEGIPQKIRKNPKFKTLESKVKWANRNSTRSDRIFIPEFSGSNEPLFTYRKLNAILPLDNFCTIGIDLVSSEKKETGFCVLKGNYATTCRVKTDEEMIRLAVEARANLISIDSPLSIPKGRKSCFDDDPYRYKGIIRQCEKILMGRGVGIYPCLIKCMQEMTHRGMQLAKKFRKLGFPVIESYPGAAQDIMLIPRKQKGLDFLVEGLKEFGLTGKFLDIPTSHDELDAITSAVVGHFFWVGMFEGLGNSDEEYLIIPDINADYKKWLSRKAIGLSGPIASGKTAAAKYLEKNGYTYARYSQVLKNLLDKNTGNISRSDLQALGWSVHKEKGQRWLGKKVLELLNDKKYVVIDGLRFLEDHALMAETYGPSFMHFHILAPEGERKKRMKQRSFDDLPLKSSAKHPVEDEINLLAKVAHNIINNDGTIESLFMQFEPHKKKG